ncbi:MAG: hypothetical protein Q4F72_05350 [Desulfovibrionaceae bacterium]|nr:hypothetical protein [Desulfovibrionaceae bacterium]
MGITLYTAPDCIRCRIVKAYLADKNIPYDTVDFKGDAQTFNTFYRANRKAIYRNPEGVEFPLFSDGEVVRQGSGEVLAYLLSGHAMEGCVTRSDMLHGKISGLYPTRCPDDQEDNFVTLVERLSAGGLEVWLQVDGRKPALLKRLLAVKNVHVILNAVGGPEFTEQTFGGCPTKEELAESISLVTGTPDGLVRFLAMPKEKDGAWIWAERADAEAAAKMVAAACGKPTLPFSIMAAVKEMPLDLHGLEPVTDQDLLMYRSAIRRHLFKADIVK